MSPDRLARQFEEHRPHLHAVATRILGSATEADDAVQEGWLRLSRSGADGVANLGGWLTTVVARICLNMLRARRADREDPAGDDLPEPAGGADPEQQALLADSVGLAMLVVLDTLRPAERVAFVLHDVFDVPYDEIGSILDRTPTAARQLASRARRRVHSASTASGPDAGRRRAVVDAFLAASRSGDFDALLELLDPDVVLRADPVAARMGGPAELRGAGAVARSFSGRAGAARTVLVDGAVGAAAVVDGVVRIVLRFDFAGDRVAAIEATADPTRLAELDLVLSDGRRPSG